MERHILRDTYSTPPHHTTTPLHHTHHTHTTACKSVVSPSCVAKGISSAPSSAAACLFLPSSPLLLPSLDVTPPPPPPPPFSSRHSSSSSSKSPKALESSSWSTAALTVSDAWRLGCMDWVSRTKLPLDAVCGQGKGCVGGMCIPQYKAKDVCGGMCIPQDKEKGVWVCVFSRTRKRDVEQSKAAQNSQYPTHTSIPPTPASHSYPDLTSAASSHHSLRCYHA